MRSHCGIYKWQKITIPRRAIINNDKNSLAIPSRAVFCDDFTYYLILFGRKPIRQFIIANVCSICYDNIVPPKR